MIEKAAQKEIVLRFGAGWIDMHKRGGDECVHAAAALHNTPCEHEAAESVNEEGGRSLKIDGLKMSVCRAPAKLDEDGRSPQRKWEQENLKRKKFKATPQKQQRRFIFRLPGVKDPQTENVSSVELLCPQMPGSGRLWRGG